MKSTSIEFNLAKVEKSKLVITWSRRIKKWKDHKTCRGTESQHARRKTRKGKLPMQSHYWHAINKVGDSKNDISDLPNEIFGMWI